MIDRVFEYQQFCETTDISNSSYEYYGLGLASEAGEVAGKIKKLSRDDNGVLTTKRREELIDELSDVQWYVARLCSKLGVTITELHTHNMLKLHARKQAKTIKGDGDVR